MTTPAKEAEAQLIEALGNPTLGAVKRTELQLQLQWIRENLSE